MAQLSARFLANGFTLAAWVGLLALPATAQTAQPSTQTVLSVLKWRNVGPGIGGRSVAVDAVPGNPFTFYFGGVDGGVWRSTNYGLTWTNISDGQLNASNSIGAIAVAPSNPKRIYAGTGEADIRNTFVTGDGVYRTNDAGKTWRYAGLKDTHTIAKIVVDPRDANIVYAASMGHVYAKNAERGIFKSTDGGEHWNKVLYVNEATGAIDLVMDPSHPTTLYAAMWQAYRTPYSLNSGGAGSGLYKTTDGGKHWVKISANSGFPTGTLGRIGVSIAASNPRIVYAIVQAKNGGIFRSDDGGARWRLVSAPSIIWRSTPTRPIPTPSTYPTPASSFRMTAARTSPSCTLRTATITWCGSIRTTRRLFWRETTAVPQCQPTVERHGAASTIS
jgi:photosystem II stability/assembly factor-like uncharacterized protein